MSKKWDFRNNFILALAVILIGMLAERFLLKPDIKTNIEHQANNLYNFEIRNENPWVVAQAVPIQIASSPTVQLEASITQGSEHIVGSFNIDNSIVYILNMPPGATIEGSVATSDSVMPRIKILGDNR